MPGKQAKYSSTEVSKARSRETAPPKPEKLKAKSRSRERVPYKSARAAREWSGDVTRNSDALDLKKGVFQSDDPKEIAKSLKHSALSSNRRKANPFRSALSMLIFYINRAGKNLSQGKRHTLMLAKERLRQLFGRERNSAIKRVK